ncbi:SigB/SigF/SigG family RNA polymerase sigma factor [Mycolicibacterium baixiangningiae]|uniref:SigB/SigF/SigG family RNA polymerase sigma factor n=1 Tax=Mycolicibacterium baixiangningiae TaxID=2761578 RepID=UPI0027DA2635|nr:SigB/SigF/SigG family RNA polymerase sigma factor [Mycolicibacterium baixiangningiae]
MTVTADQRDPRSSAAGHAFEAAATEESVIEQSDGHSHPDYGEVDDLCRQLDQCIGRAERQRCRRLIITTCLPLADHIAYRFVGRGEPSDDLIQVARLGLIKTIDRYQPTKGRFLAFAVPTIQGELRRYFRDSTWTVRVPRNVQETHLRTRAAADALSQQLSRAPTTSELAREVGVDCDQIAESQVAGSAYHPTSLDQPCSSAESHGGDTVGSLRGADDCRYHQVEDAIMLHDAIAELDPRRRAIVGMSFFEDLTQRQIARRLGVSQVQVSRLLSDTLARIRDRVCIDAPCRQGLPRQEAS